MLDLGLSHIGKIEDRDILLIDESRVRHLQTILMPGIPNYLNLHGLRFPLHALKRHARRPLGRRLRLGIDIESVLTKCHQVLECPDLPFFLRRILARDHRRLRRHVIAASGSLERERIADAEKASLGGIDCGNMGERCGWRGKRRLGPHLAKALAGQRCVARVKIHFDPLHDRIADDASYGRSDHELGGKSKEGVL